MAPFPADPRDCCVEVSLNWIQTETSSRGTTSTPPDLLEVRTPGLDCLELPQADYSDRPTPRLFGALLVEGFSQIC